MYELEIHHLDVGQGDCTVLVARDTSANSMRCVVIDCGGGKNGIDESNAGLKLVKFLIERDIHRIDIFITTHYERDHFGGTIVLLELANKGKTYIDLQGGTRNYRDLLANTIFFDRGEPGSYDQSNKSFSYSHTNSSYNKYVKLLRELRGTNTDQNSGVRRVNECVYGNPNFNSNNLNFALKNTDFTLQPNDRWRTRNYQFEPPYSPIGMDVMNNYFDFEMPVHLTCLAASQICQNPDNLNDYVRINGLRLQDENDYSLAFLLSFFNFHYYLGGELPRSGERAILRRVMQLTGKNGLTGMKASHHGSNTGTDPQFLGTTAPHFVTISCGPSNKHKHPTKEIMDLLDDQDSIERVYLTGYGGPTDDPRNPEYYTPYNSKTKFQFAGSDLHNQPGNIFFSTDNTRASKDSPEMMVGSFTQNFMMRFVPEQGFENFWPTTFVMMSTLIDDNGNSRFPWLTFSKETGEGVVSDDQNRRAGRLIVVGDTEFIQF